MNFFFIYIALRNYHVIDLLSLFLLLPYCSTMKCINILFRTAILHFRTFRNCKKQQLKLQHAIIHGCIVVLLVLDAVAALASHLLMNPPEPNFYSLHSWMGISTIVLYMILVCAIIPSACGKCKI